MKFKNYISEMDYNILYYIYLTDEINEISDELLLKLETLGKNVGIKVRKSKTFQYQLANAGKGVLHLTKLIIDYSIHADILDPKARQQLENDIRSSFSKVKKEDVVSFFVNIDKTFLGITSIPRHILQNILGISVTAFDNYVSGTDYIEKNMGKIISTLHDMGETESEGLARKIYTNVTGKEIKI